MFKLNNDILRPGSPKASEAQLKSDVVTTSEEYMKFLDSTEGLDTTKLSEAFMKHAMAQRALNDFEDKTSLVTQRLG